MPRLPRIKSSTGIYHAMIRGINKEKIFETPENKTYFLDMLYKIKVSASFKLYAYAIMDNHAHLLIDENFDDENSDNIDIIFKRICTTYALWYNKNSNRVGHVFQDRYKSEPVEDEKYFLSVLRYIHNNPVKAGIAVSAKDYIWSSYTDLLIQNNELLDTRYVLDMFHDNNRTALKMLTEFNDTHSSTEHLELKEDRSNKAIYENIYAVTGIEAEDFCKIPQKEMRDLFIKKVKSEIKISNRELAEITGLGRNVIDRAK